MQGNNGRRYSTYLHPTNDSAKEIGRTPKVNKKRTQLGRKMRGRGDINRHYANIGTPFAFQHNSALFKTYQIVHLKLVMIFVNRASKKANRKACYQGKKCIGRWKKRYRGE